MRAYRTEPKGNTSISTMVSKLYDNTTKVTDKVRTIGQRMYITLQNEIAKLYEIKKDVGAGIELILQKIESLYQQIHQNKIRVGIVVNTTYGNRIISPGVLYGNQKTYGDDGDIIPGLFHAMKGMYTVNINQFKGKKKHKKKKNKRKHPWKSKKKKGKD